jgi:hypothetical protein
MSILPQPLNEADLYRLLPLEDDMIRVVDIYPTNAMPLNTPLTGRIRVVSLSENNPKFVALSYCWGSTPRDEYTHEIHIESEHGTSTMAISETAHGALADLRVHLGSTTIWIDAICINQCDHSEKAMQIPLMREIYTRATTVYVHLGPGTESTDAALGWMTQVSRRRYRGTGILGPGSWGTKKYKFLHLMNDFWTGMLTGYDSGEPPTNSWQC